MSRPIALALALLLMAGPVAPTLGADAPLADAHIHYSAPDWSVYSPDQVVAILDRAGIRRALVSSTPDDGTLKLYDRDPKRVVPMLRPYQIGRASCRESVESPEVAVVIKGNRQGSARRHG